MNKPTDLTPFREFAALLKDGENIPLAWEEHTPPDIAYLDRVFATACGLSLDDLLAEVEALREENKKLQSYKTIYYKRLNGDD